MKRNHLLALAIAALAAMPAWAQPDSIANGHTGDHQTSSATGTSSTSMGAMNHEGMNQGGMPGMQHGIPDDSNPRSATENIAQGDGSMDHGDMSMQGGSAPLDARDPHAYADGYTLEDGKYALAGPQRLHLADEQSFGSVLFDRLERVYTRDDNATAYDAQAWFGRDYDRLVLKAEGEYARGKMQEARTELLWSHAVASYWDAQLGLRYDSGEGPDRSWLALGAQGLAPYWFELDATAYVGGEGRTALRLEAEYELLLTQRLVLQPRVEINFYGKSDEDRGIGSGLSDASGGLRLRYEISRQFAPYIGVQWAGTFGQTADMARAAGERSSETGLVAGLRFWF